MLLYGEWGGEGKAEKEPLPVSGDRAVLWDRLCCGNKPKLSIAVDFAGEGQLWRPFLFAGLLMDIYLSCIESKEEKIIQKQLH